MKLEITSEHAAVLNSGEKPNDRIMDIAVNFPAKTYPQELPCANCGFRWRQHLGLCCRVNEGGEISPVRGPKGERIVDLPNFYRNRFFIPDWDYFQEPDFDVV
jgi:hypothetical protein